MQTKSEQDSAFESNPQTMLTSQRQQLSKFNNSIHLIFKQQRSFFQRAFSPLGKGAMRGSIFALIAASMGTGMFNLPFRLEQIGLIPYVIFVIMGTIFAYIGMYLIARIIKKFKVESYAGMCQRAYGKPFKRFAEFCLILFSWGITICFQVLFAKFVVELLNDNFQAINFYEERKTQKFNDTGNLVRILINIGSILLNLLFILKKQIGILQKLALVGVFAVLINTIIITVTFFTGFSMQKCEEPIIAHCTYEGVSGIGWDKISYVNLDNNNDLNLLVQAFASILFSFVSHQLVFPLAYDLKNPTMKRMCKIFKRVHFIECVTYIVVGILGYLLLVEHIEEVSIAPMVMSSIQTILMSVGKIFITCAMFFAVPLNIFPCRQAIFEAFGFVKNNKNHIIVSLVLAFSGTTIAIFFSSVNSYFGLLGGTTGVLMAGTIPAICYYKLFGCRLWYHAVMNVFVAFVTVLGVVGGVLSVVMMD